MFSLSREYGLAADEAMMWGKLEQDIDRVAEDLILSGRRAPSMNTMTQLVQDMAAAITEVSYHNVVNLTKRLPHLHCIAGKTRGILG